MQQQVFVVVVPKEVLDGTISAMPAFGMTLAIKIICEGNYWQQGAIT